MSFGKIRGINMGNIIQIKGDEIFSNEEKIKYIKTRKIQEFLDDYGFYEPLIEKILDFKQSDVVSTLLAHEHYGFKVASDHTKLEVFTPRIQDKNFFYKINNNYTNIINPNALPDQDIIEFIKNYPNKDNLIIKQYCGIKFADLLFDHVLTTGIVPLIDTFLIFNNYIFVQKPFLNNFEDEKKFLVDYAFQMKAPKYPMFIIKDY
jgi:hypothetical protein